MNTIAKESKWLTRWRRRASYEQDGEDEDNKKWRREQRENEMKGEEKPNLQCQLTWQLDKTNER